MSTAEKTARAGLHRLVDAIGNVASELGRVKGQQTAVPYDWRRSLIEGQRNVIKYYRQVMATQRMPPTERTAVLDRIARIEEEIRELEAGGQLALKAG